MFLYRRGKSHRSRLSSITMAPLWPFVTLQDSEISYLKPRVLDKNFPTTPGVGPQKNLNMWLGVPTLCLSQQLLWADEVGHEKKVSSPTSRGQEGPCSCACWHLNLSSSHPMGPRLEWGWGRKCFWSCLCCFCDPDSAYSWDSLRK